MEGTLSWQGAVLPPGAPIRRRLPHLSGWKTDDPALRARYDAETLIYAAQALPARGLLRLHAPRPFNLRGPLVRARYATALGPLPAPRVAVFKRYATLDFPLPSGVDAVQIALPGLWEGAIPVLHANPAPLAGLNVLYTMSQNNDLAWIADWVAYHVRAHGAQAVVIADNASTAYEPGALLAFLSTLPGVRAARVLAVPHRYGPSSAVLSRASAGRFLQSAAANFARDGWLAQARAVLSCDIDEVVIDRDGRSIFDRAVASRWGAVTFPGYWRFPSTAGARHADHTLTRPDRAAPCPTKYAIVPDSVLGRRSWMTHGPEGWPRRWFSAAPQVWFAHCHGISTRWKAGRGDEGDAEGVQDPEVAAAWARAGLDR